VGASSIETILTDIPQMDAGSSQVCDILGFPASLGRRQQARDGCWDMPKGSGAAGNAKFVVIKTHVSRGLIERVTIKGLTLSM
jgi:hypothetical protein